MVNVSKFIPWKSILRRTARKHGFLDPLTLLGKMRAFSQPSEVSEPIELIRAGAYFHARGLINARAIQNNMDWIWPYWVEKQFDPHSPSFVPRAFSVTHINLTHRNWTAVGVPGFDAYPIVDPRGLVTPFWDGWSLDAWYLLDDGRKIIPSRSENVEQQLILLESGYQVKTECLDGNAVIESVVTTETRDSKPVCSVSYRVKGSEDGRFILSLRPYNPEGISFINQIEYITGSSGWKVDEEKTIRLDEEPEQHIASNYKQGDVFRTLDSGENDASIECEAGLANAAVVYPVERNEEKNIDFSVNLLQEPESQTIFNPGSDKHSWEYYLQDTAKLQIPDEQIQHLYNAAVRSLILHSPDWTYPGPYTYKRFWYRDAALITNGLLDANLISVAERILDNFPEKQTFTGFYHSQEGEWDSNGEVLWIYNRFCELTGALPKSPWMKSIEKGAKWIQRKRESGDIDELHAGLMPSGFSAEHLGNIDNYYWDDFWSIAGLQAAQKLVDSEKNGDEFQSTADDMMEAVMRSLERSRHIRDYPAIPASPYRRMDAGAVGSIVAGYPLNLFAPENELIIETVEYLINECFVDGAFFQDMVHSGLNAYLTLHVAQNLLRTGDLRFVNMVKRIGELASPTGQWPEAIHPRTKGGCMGDGHHVWASAEWVAMIRNMFVREEGDQLILGSGIFPEWLQQEEDITFGSTPTSYGDVTLHIASENTDKVEIGWDANWRESPAEMFIRLPGIEDKIVENPDEQDTISLEIV